MLYPLFYINCFVSVWIQFVCTSELKETSREEGSIKCIQVHLGGYHLFSSVSCPPWTFSFWDLVLYALSFSCPILFVFHPTPLSAALYHGLPPFPQSLGSHFSCWKKLPNSSMISPLIISPLLSLSYNPLLFKAVSIFINFTYFTLQ